jgi:DNA-binding transcriptional regulator YhcF (GntR family)
LKPVSTSTEQALQAALARLVSGEPVRTDSRLTVANLAREAGVSRATANRAPSILAELREAVAKTAVQPWLARPRSSGIDEERVRHELENVIAQHVQARALLQRAEERRIGKVVGIRAVKDGK